MYCCVRLDDTEVLSCLRNVFVNFLADQGVYIVIMATDKQLTAVVHLDEHVQVMQAQRATGTAFLLFLMCIMMFWPSQPAG